MLKVQLTEGKTEIPNSALAQILDVAGDPIIDRVARGIEGPVIMPVDVPV
jgi:hypothetical protein